jgi:hypothetical protein
VDSDLERFWMSHTVSFDPFWVWSRTGDYELVSVGQEGLKRIG